MSTKTEATGASVYSEPVIAKFTTQYRESPLTKPQDIELNITRSHIYGKSYIVQQIATYEEEVFYSRFAENLSEVKKISINTFIKDKPIYISFEWDNKDNKNARDRKRILIPALTCPEDVVELLRDVISKMRGTEFASEMTATKKSKAYERQLKREYTDAFEPQQIKNTETLLSGTDDGESVKEFSFDEIEKTTTAPMDGAAVLEDLDFAPELEPIDFTQMAEHTDETSAPPVSKKRPSAIPEPPDGDADSMPEIIMTATGSTPQIPPAEEKAEPTETPEVTEAAEIEATAATESVPEITAIAPTESTPSKPEAKLAPMSLGDFETAVKKLKVMLDSGVITDVEFSAEKKKLLATLY
ncbi:MAG: SHOCT domain-containing protein [Ruminococcus sp.]|nr:SHOCT domain-containing protein [Ruminococcus sp.]